MTDTQLFERVCDHVRETAILRSSLALLEWDQQTNLPPKANEHRTRQITLLSGLIHQRATEPQLGEWLGLLSESMNESTSPEQKATIRELNRDYQKLSKFPPKLVQSLAQQASEGQAVWLEAKKNNDFASMVPYFRRMFKLKREQAEVLGYEEEPYDALLDEYEPGAKSSEVAEVLSALKRELVPLVDSVLGSDAPDDSFLSREFPIEAQEKLGREVTSAIGFDYERGRLDVTHHPFCTELGPNDCRILTRYNLNFFSSAIFGSLHEAGHGIYEQGLRREEYGLPLGSYCSLGIHESQSRLWENLVGRSLAFWEHFFPRAKQLFEAALSDVDLPSFYRAINGVKRSVIRVEADEATYDLHIIVRFELERMLINDGLDVADLAEAWNEKYEKLLGVRPKNDGEGVLQDIHWPLGLVGYFPTYSLGNLYASQFFEAAESELGDLAEMFRRGTFTPLKMWLNQKVHHAGKMFTGPELSQRVTGKPLKHDALIRHLKGKLLPIYS